jgi:hypothetical protein
LLGNPGAAVFGTAKAGVAAMTMIAAIELAESRIRINTVASAARTPMSGKSPVGQSHKHMRPPTDPTAFDQWHPANISRLVAYLATEDCPINGEVFHVRGGVIAHFEGWTMGGTVDIGRRWAISELRERLPALVAKAPDRQAAGGAAYASLRADLGRDRLQSGTGK